MKTNPITFLQRVEDNDGAYNFYPIEECSSMAHAIATAWKRHDNFLESENGEDYRGDDCLNVHEDDFVKSISENGMVVTANEDMTCRRIYKLITIEIRSSVSVVCG